MKRKSSPPTDGELEDDDAYNYVIVGVNGEEEMPHRMKLPSFILLDDPRTGEPSILKKRTFPRALRYYKKNADKNAHKFYLSELFLYFPFRNECELFPDDEKKCFNLYDQNKEKINMVKKQVSENRLTTAVKVPLTV